jgi:hypothetical protein
MSLPLCYAMLMTNNSAGNSLSQDLVLVESSTFRAMHAARTDVLTRFKDAPDGEYVTTEMVAAFYQVPMGTIRTYVRRNRIELAANGYRVIPRSKFQSETPAGQSVQGTRIAVFSQRAVLIIGMLLVGSDVARMIRHALLDDVLSRSAAGTPKTVKKRAAPRRTLELAPGVQRSLDYAAAADAIGEPGLADRWLYIAKILS